MDITKNVCSQVLFWKSSIPKSLNIVLLTPTAMIELKEKKKGPQMLTIYLLALVLYICGSTKGRESRESYIIDQENVLEINAMQHNTALLKDFTPPKLFVFAIYAFTADSFTCVCTSQKHNAILFELKQSSQHSEKKKKEKEEKLERVFFLSGTTDY